MRIMIQKSRDRAAAPRLAPSLARGPGTRCRHEHVEGMERVSAATAGRLPVLLPPGPARGGGAAPWAGRFGAPAAYLVFGLVDILVFGLHAKGDVTFSFTPEFAKVSVPNLSLAAAATAYCCGAVTAALAAVRLLDVLGVVAAGRAARRVLIGAVLFLFVIALLAWASGGQPIPFNVVNLLSGTLSESIPMSYPGLDRSRLPTFLYLWQPDPTLPRTGAR